MKKLSRNLTDEKSAAFWASVEETAASVRDLPAWMKAGIDINPRHFETYEPWTPEDDDAVPRERNRLVGK
jgi:hypothetical protein